jgi:hypothetical protein
MDECFLPRTPQPERPENPPEHLPCWNARMAKQMAMMTPELREEMEKLLFSAPPSSG